MREVYFDSVVSCSSEDKHFPSDNLLKPDLCKKFKCAKPGEDRVVIILQLDRPYAIEKIAVGNECSAFLEILVGRASTPDEKDYKVLVATVCLMNLNDSKLNANTNRQRTFSIEDETMDKKVAKEKWDRVKLVCMQKFNRQLQYGLSFIRIFVSGSEPAGAADEANDSKQPSTLGKFRLTADAPSDSKLTPGALFNAREHTTLVPVKKPDAKPLSVSEAVRAANEEYLNRSPQSAASLRGSPSQTSAAKNAKATSDTTVRNKAEPIVAQDKKPPPAKANASHPANVKDKLTAVKQPSVAIAAPSSAVAAPSSAVAAPSSAVAATASSSSDPKNKPSPRVVPFSELFADVTFALSGFENPFRADLREQAAEMGAKYKADWTKDCTHLICAFSNTPKYNQVKGKGKIVRKEWILDSYKQRKRLSWAKYAFEKLGNAVPDEELVAAPSGTQRSSSQGSAATQPKQQQLAKAKPPPATAASSSKQTDDDIFDLTTDDEEEIAIESDGGDTDDEIRRHKSKSEDAKAKMTASASKKEQPVTAASKRATGPPTSIAASTSTSSAQPSPKKAKVAPTPVRIGPDGLAVLPTFFAGHYFFLFGGFPEAERKQLLRFITAFDGELEDYMSEVVTHVVTKEHWTADFDDALRDNPRLQFVRPEWILNCGKQNRYVNVKEYLVEKDF